MVGKVLFCLLVLLIIYRSEQQVESKKVVDQLLELAQFSDHAFPQVTRILFTQNDIKARQYVKQLMKNTGLEIKEDSMGNIFGIWEGKQSDKGMVLTGSHCDAIPRAGMYDGTLGVLGAIEAIRVLKQSEFEPDLSITVVMFTSEEPTRFGIGCIGSRVLSGSLSEKTIANLRDENGTNFLIAAETAGYKSPNYSTLLSSTKLSPSNVSYFVELHIEQGPILENEGLDIGVVAAIAAPSTIRGEFVGDGGHAGGQLMPERNDALLAAAELALVVEKSALGTGDVDTVGTMGHLIMEPNTVNSVPRVAKFEIDIRDIEVEQRDKVVEEVVLSAKQIGEKRNVRHKVEILNQDSPTTCDPKVISAIESSIHELELKGKRLVSRAYHDSLFMARIAPTGMIFVPCRKGVSHRPDEFVEEVNIKNGIEVLSRTLVNLSKL